MTKLPTPEELANVLPYEVCLACAGDGCTICFGSGQVPPSSVSAIRADREAIKKWAEAEIDSTEHMDSLARYGNTVRAVLSRLIDALNGKE